MVNYHFCVKREIENNENLLSWYQKNKIVFQFLTYIDSYIFISQKIFQEKVLLTQIFS